MSRGPGQLQKFIFGEVESARRPLLLNHLMWRFAEQHEGRKPEAGGELSKSVYTSFRRAANGLVESGELEAQSRRLLTLDELIEHYPYKTRSVALRDLRLQLLPHLRTLPAIDKRLRSRFSASENENFIVQDRRRDASLQSRWLQVRTRLLENTRALTDLKAAHVHANLVVRGDAVFLPDRGIVHPGSFVDLANRLMPHLAPSVAEELLRFCNEIWPSTQRTRVALKSQLYAWVKFSGSSKPSLKPDAREALRELEPTLIGELIIERTSRGLRGFHEFRIEPVKHKPLLDQLLMRDALSPFEFIGLPGTIKQDERTPISPGSESKASR
jgi:hypothetical protein